MYQIPQGALIGHSTGRAPDRSQDQHVAQRCWTTRIIMFYPLFVFIQYATSSGNSLTAIFICFRGLMSCINSSWVMLNTDCNGCSDTWKLDMTTINLTIHSDRYHEIQVSGISPNDSIELNAALPRQIDPGHDQNTELIVYTNNWLLQWWQENSGGHNLLPNGEVSSVCIIWILFTC
jgi:hypothetical protein